MGGREGGREGAIVLRRVELTNCEVYDCSERPTSAAPFFPKVGTLSCLVV